MDAADRSKQNGRHIGLTEKSKTNGGLGRSIGPGLLVPNSVDKKGVLMDAFLVWQSLACHGIKFCFPSPLFL